MMADTLEKKLKRFNNLPDYRKLEELVLISENEIDSDAIEFLFQIIEKEKFEKIRIKAIFILKELKSEEIAKRFMKIYAFERENSVRLVLAEAIGDIGSPEIDDFLVKIVSADENDVIRSIAIRKIHERANLGKEKIKNLLHEVIQNDGNMFPIQISLGILPYYADDESLNILKSCYRIETKNKMKLLLYQTMTRIADDLNQELGIRKPIIDDSLEDSEQTKKKKRRLRIRKKDKKDEEYLFF